MSIKNLLATVIIFATLLSPCFLAYSQNELLPPTITASSQISTSEIKFNFTQSASPIANISLYDVYLTEDGNLFSSGGLSSTASFYSAIGVKPGKNYCLKIRARGNSNNYSPYSNIYCGTTINTLKPPTLTTTQQFSSSVLKVNFTPDPTSVFNSTTGPNHKLYFRKQNEVYGEFSVGQFLPYNYFAFTSAQAGQQYCFKAKAVEYNVENCSDSTLYSTASKQKQWNIMLNRSSFQMKYVLQQPITW